MQYMNVLQMGSLGLTNPELHYEEYVVGDVIIVQ